jgi:hypothetical protein
VIRSARYQALLRRTAPVPGRVGPSARNPPYALNGTSGLPLGRAPWSIMGRPSPPTSHDMRVIGCCSGAVTRVPITGTCFATMIIYCHVDAGRQGRPGAHAMSHGPPAPGDLGVAGDPSGPHDRHRRFRPRATQPSVSARAVPIAPTGRLAAAGVGCGRALIVVAEALASSPARFAPLRGVRGYG